MLTTGSHGNDDVSGQGGCYEFLAQAQAQRAYHSSTEAELIGIDDALPYIMWGLSFIKAQGYEVTHNILYQDNKSTILLA